MPSAFPEGRQRDYQTNLWLNNTDDIRQVRWHDFYAWNRQNNERNPYGQAFYMLSRRHSNSLVGTFNSTYTHQLTNDLRLTAGIGASRSRARQFQTVDDLLGANQWLDIDNFISRNVDLNTVDPRIVLNNVNDTTTIRHNGDIWGHKFDLHITNANVFAQLEHQQGRLRTHFAVQGTYTSFYRFGHMENGRTWWLRHEYETSGGVRGQNVHSFGRGDTWWFIDPSVKAGFNYNIDNRNFISANILAETRAPVINNAFVNERTRDMIAPHLTNERILSYDLSYHFNHRTVRGRISGFRTHIHDRVDKTVYFDDMYSSLVSHVMSGSNRILQGIEAGFSIPLNREFTLNIAGTIADHRYTNNAHGIINSESGLIADEEDIVMTRGLRVSNGPQTAANIQLRYFRRGWFADIVINYFDRSFVSFSPSRFTRSTFGNLPYEFYEERNLRRLRNEFTNSAGMLDIAGLNQRLADENFRTQWGLQADEAVNFGLMGGIIQHDENGNPIIASSDARQALGTQERLPSGFLVDLSVGRIIFLPNRRQVNINLSVNNVLNNTNLASTGFQQGRMAMTGTAQREINLDALDRFPNRYFWAQGINFSMNLTYRF